jgi:hypothetical protein
MNLTAEQLRIASMIDAKMQKLVDSGNNDITILTEMFDCMPDFKRLLDTSESDAMDELCRRFAGFFRSAPGRAFPVSYAAQKPPPAGPRFLGSSPVYG